MLKEVEASFQSCTGCRSQVFRPLSAAFPGTLAGRQIRSGGSGTSTDVHIGYEHYKGQVKLMCYNAGLWSFPSKYIILALKFYRFCQWGWGNFCLILVNALIMKRYWILSIFALFKKVFFTLFCLYYMYYNSLFYIALTLLRYFPLGILYILIFVFWIYLLENLRIVAFLFIVISSLAFYFCFGNCISLLGLL